MWPDAKLPINLVLCRARSELHASKLRTTAIGFKKRSTIANAGNDRTAHRDFPWKEEGCADGNGLDDRPRGSNRAGTKIEDLDDDSRLAADREESEPALFYGDATKVARYRLIIKRSLYARVEYGEIYTRNSRPDARKNDKYA